jgi:hypothetical protein
MNFPMFPINFFTAFYLNSTSEAYWKLLENSDFHPYWSQKNVRFEVFTAVTMKNVVAAATCSRWFLARGFFYPEDEDDTFLRKVSSHKIWMAPHPRRRRSSLAKKFRSYEVINMQMSKIILNDLCHWPPNSVACSPQANYTDRGTAACRRS